MERYVVYTRVSTDKQEKSGLGLDAQGAAFTAYAQTNGHTVIESHTETTSGMWDEAPPVLMHAVARCKLFGATLGVSHQTRLGRTVSEVLGFAKKHGVTVFCLDNPTNDPTLGGIQAVLGQREVTLLRERVVAAMGQLKAKAARGETWISKAGNVTDHLGGRNPDKTACYRDVDFRLGNAANMAKAEAFCRRTYSTIADLRQSRTLAQVADTLTAMGVPTAMKGTWTPKAVSRVMECGERIGLGAVSEPARPRMSEAEFNRRYDELVALWGRPDGGEVELMAHIATTPHLDALQERT